MCFLLGSVCVCGLRQYIACMRGRRKPKPAGNVQSHILEMKYAVVRGLRVVYDKASGALEHHEKAYRKKDMKLGALPNSLTCRYKVRAVVSPGPRDFFWKHATKKPCHARAHTHTHTKLTRGVPRRLMLV